MYFIKNANEGGECLCSGAYDPALPSDRYKLSLSPVVVPPTDQQQQQYSVSMTPARSASYMKTPAAYMHTAHKYQHESSQMMPASRRAAACTVPPAPYQRAAACSVPPAPASYQRAAAATGCNPASYRRAAAATGCQVMPAAAAYRPRQPARRVAMLREPVATMTRALYEDTESSRPFDYMVDYGNTFGGYSAEPQTIDPPPTQTSTTDDIFFNPGTIDQTSEQYKEALRLYYDKLGYPNFTPKNGYDYGIEFFDKGGLQSVPLRTAASYGTISKF